MKLCQACALSAAMVVLLASAPAVSSYTETATFVFEAPQGVTAAQVFALIAPGEDQHLATFIGLQKWRQKEDTYVGIVCLAADKKQHADDLHYCHGDACCRSEYGGFNEAKDPRRIFLGVVEYKERLKLVASSGGPLNVVTSWKNSNIDPNDDDVKNAGAYPDIYKSFDFAPYKVSKDQVAFGLRVAWQTAYAGGGGLYDALMLFLVRGDKVVNILSEPMEEYGDSGSGDEKNSWETNNVLRILPHKHAGYFDLQIKDRDRKWKKTFQWDAQADRYLPLPR